MERRKFLKLLTWSPVAFLIPKILVSEKLQIPKQSKLDSEFIARRDWEMKKTIETYKIPKLMIGIDKR